MQTSTRPLRVLIVDDNRDGADTLGLLVEELGHQVHVTYGGTNALKVATTFRPDLILVDLVMPGMDGCDLVMRLREMPAHPGNAYLTERKRRDRFPRLGLKQTGSPLFVLAVGTVQQG